MNAIKDINIICDEGVEPIQLRAVIEGIEELLLTGGVKDKIKIRNFGVWRMPVWRQGNELLPYQSIDWYLMSAMKRLDRTGRFQLDAEVILENCAQELWQVHEPHYDVLVTSYDLCTENCNWVMGGAREGLGMVISTWRWRDIPEDEQYEHLKTAAIHEGGHVFGLTDRFDQFLAGIFKGHCVNLCAMRQGLTIKEFILYTIDRLEHGALCPECKKELRAFFKKKII